MKKIVYFIIFILSVFLHVDVLANENNESNTIQKAILIENYIIKHKIRIEDFIKKYNIKNISNLENNIKELDESIAALNKIKNSEVQIEKSEEIMTAIIKRIKYINENLKEILNIEKINFESNLKNKKIIYSKIAIKIADKIDDINIKIAKKILVNNDSLSLRESNIKENLIKLNKESKKLKYFWNINFNSEKEIKESFIRILNNIKRELLLMKKSLK